MAVTVQDLTTRVRWTDNGRTHTGILHRLPEPGTTAWYRTSGKATVLEHLADGGTAWVHVHPYGLHPIDQAEAEHG